MERIHSDYSDMGVTVLGVVQREGLSRLSRFKQEFKISYTVLADPADEVAAMYVATGNVTILVIDKSGIVRYVGGYTPWPELAEEIDAIIGGPEEVDLSSAELATQALKNPDMRIRRKAAEALGEMRDAGVLPHLTDALKDETASVREVAVQALGKIGGDEVMEALATALEDESSFVQMEAVKALGNMKDERTVPLLVKSLANADIRSDVAAALVDIGRPELVSEPLEEHFAVFRIWGDSEDFAQACADLGTAYMERKMYSDAAAAYEKAIRVLSDDDYRKGDYLKNLMDCYTETGEEEKAVTEYLTMIRNSPGGQPYIYYSNSDGTMAGYNKREYAVKKFVEAFEGQQKLDDLAEALEAEIPRSPKDSGLYETLGSIYDKQSMSEKAVSAYEKLVELQPANAKRYAQLAAAYKRSGMTDNALAVAAKIAERSGDAYIHNFIGRTLAGSGMYDEAAAAYRKAIEMTQDGWELGRFQGGLAKCYRNAGKYAEALAVYEDLIEKSTSSYDRDAARRSTWEVYEEGNLYGVAVEKYQKMVEAKPDDPEAHESLARAYRGNEELDKAIAEYERVAELKPEDAGVFETLGSVYKEQGNSEKVIACYKEAMMLAPDNSSLNVKLGDFYREQGMMGEAAAEYDKSQAQRLAQIEQGATDPAVYDRVARFYIDKEVKPQEAISLAQKAVELAMDNPAFMNTLASAYSNAGQIEKAQRQWAAAGFVSDANWLVVGPFDNTDGIGFSEVYPPEQSIDVHATYQGKMEEITWVRAKDELADAYVDLARMFDENEWTVAYALARVTSPEDREAQLRVGRDDDVKVWLNGEEVLSKNVGQAAAIDQDIIPVNLKSGANEILMKICNRIGLWGLYLRITDTEGKPYDDLDIMPVVEHQ